MYLLVPSERKEATTSSDEKPSKIDAGNGNDGDSKEIVRLKRAAATALAAAAVKAKFLAKQEEDQIRQLVTVIIEKQVHLSGQCTSPCMKYETSICTYLQLSPTPYSHLPGSQNKLHY